MTCYSPVEAFQSPRGGPLIFYNKPGYKQLTVPCNYCIGCKIDRKLQWTTRSVHEAQMHEENSFVTLTYDDEHLPPGFTLVKKDMSDFIKRLRRRIDYYSPGHRIKFRGCGEYGDNTYRPHFHILIHGFTPPDLEPYQNVEDYWTYTSDLLDEIWGNGFTVTADVNKSTAAYVNGYLDKKFMYQDYEETHKIVDPRDGKTYIREPEYVTTSTGYGKTWFQEFKTDCYPTDSVVIDGRQVKPPAYYDRLFKIDDEESLEKIKAKRKQKRDERIKLKGEVPQYRLDTQAECKILGIEHARKTKKGKL